MPESTSHILNAWICQPQSGNLIPVFGNIRIGRGKIVEIRETDFRAWVAGNPDTTRQDAGENVRDAAGRMVTLPLINFHEHFYSRLAKGLPVSAPQDTFTHILENLWWKLDRSLDADMIRASVQMGIRECIRHGVTYIFDHHASPLHTEQTLDLAAALMKENHLRGVLCFEVSDRHGRQVMEAALQENRRFIREGADREIGGMLGLHAPFTLSDEALRLAADLRRELDTAIHIHLAEDIKEQEYSRRHFGISPAERLDRFQLLTARSLLAHGVHLTADDYTLISRAGSALVYNPDSNLNNQVGLPVYGDVPPDIPILPGTDGMHAGVARTLKQLFLLHRQQGHSFPQSFRWIEKIYFDSLAFITSFFPDFPSLQPGERADLVVWDYVPPTPLTAENIWGHLIYGMLESPAHSVVQGGHLLLDRQQVTAGDERAIFQEISRQGERLYRIFQEQR